MSERGTVDTERPGRQATAPWPVAEATVTLESPSRQSAPAPRRPSADRLVGQNVTFSTTLMPIVSDDGAHGGVLYGRARPVED
jgi:hypothetical protein